MYSCQKEFKGCLSALIHPSPVNLTKNHIIKFKENQGKGNSKGEKKNLRLYLRDKLFSNKYRNILKVKRERTRGRNKEGR